MLALRPARGIGAERLRGRAPAGPACDAGSTDQQRRGPLPRGRSHRAETHCGRRRHSLTSQRTTPIPIRIPARAKARPRSGSAGRSRRRRRAPGRRREPGSGRGRPGRGAERDGRVDDREDEHEQRDGGVGELLEVAGDDQDRGERGGEQDRDPRGPPRRSRRCPTAAGRRPRAPSRRAAARP